MSQPLRDQPSLKHLDTGQTFRRNVVVEFLQDRSRMQLAMGELTEAEYLAAKAAIRYALFETDKMGMLAVPGGLFGND